jgi:phenylalanyl-tRNA synthetase alpha chain
MRQDIINIKNEAFAQIMDAKSSKELERLRISYLGRSGTFTKLIKDIKDLSLDQRKEVGILINETKKSLEKLIASQKNKLKDSVRAWFDPTIPGVKAKTGHLHLVTQAIDEIQRIFEGMGFTRVRYPEVEWDWYAFTALNFQKDHPARDEWETFFINTKPSKKYGKMLLTPHTSSGQVREMLRLKSTPPVRMLNIAKNHRRELDASHIPMFHQFEGLVIDEGINITHLKGTLEHFVKHFYGPKIKIRLRPHNFEFTEPSFEVDTTCTICEGKNCKVCKEGWLEQAGAGMVHPNVLKAGGIDPKKYTGFAWGWGVERALMMKANLKIPDIRTLFSTDTRYLRQY